MTKHSSRIRHIAISNALRWVNIARFAFHIQIYIVCRSLLKADKNKGNVLNALSTNKMFITKWNHSSWFAGTHPTRLHIRNSIRHPKCFWAQQKHIHPPNCSYSHVGQHPHYAMISLKHDPLLGTGRLQEVCFSMMCTCTSTSTLTYATAIACAAWLSYVILFILTKNKNQTNTFVSLAM